MASDDDFELWLGRIGKQRPFLHQVIASANRAGRTLRSPSGKRSSFTGSRIGRGAGIGRILSFYPGSGARRVIVKTSIVKLGPKGLGRATAHLRYLERDGTTRDGERGTLYGPEQDSADRKAFLEHGAGDRHQFRFIVSPEDGAEYEDLKTLVRNVMTQVGKDLGTELDWVAVDHFNTGHPHSHIIVRGKDDLGKDLIIAREYLTQGIRRRAEEQVDLDLGPRTEQEIKRAALREVEQERFTSIDRRLIASMDDEHIVRAVHRDSVEQSLRAGRLQVLGRMGLATELGQGRWRLEDGLEDTLRVMGERGDIIRTMQRQLTERLSERSLADYVIHDMMRDKAPPIIGKVIARGLSHEQDDRHYLIVDGVDGLSHYVDIGSGTESYAEGSIVRIDDRAIAGLREVDYRVANIAAANGGKYDVDIHLDHDRTAMEPFAEAHVRRLEAIRRTTGGATREPNGTWLIGPDHLEKVQEYERALVARNPVEIATLSPRPVGALQRHDGKTWLDTQITAEIPVTLGRGFGVEVKQAIDARRQWLVEQNLAEIDGETIRFRANLLATLQQRELRRVAGQMSSELGMNFVEARYDHEISGTFRKSIMVGDTKFAMIEKSREFTLVPWRPTLERAIGKQISGIMRDDGTSWTIGRQRGLNIGM